MNNNYIEAFQEFKGRLNSFKEKLDLINKNEIQKSFIFFGPAGSGKTTLLHALNGNNLTIQMTIRGPIITTEENLQIPGRIGQNSNSETPESNLFYNNETKTLFIDCPGQEDVHGWTQDLANAFYTFSVFSSCQSKFLLYIVSEPNIARAVVFRNSLEQLLRLFYNNFNELKNSSYLIFTMKQHISDFALVLAEIDMDQRSMEYIRFLISKNRILFFSHPSQFYGRKILLMET